MEQDPSQAESVTAPGVLEKYQSAGRITKAVLQEVIDKCVVGAKVVDICEFGDNRIEEETAKIYKGKKIERGIAFPTCLSVNEICGHFSPLKSDEPVVELAEGDVVKIDIGAQFDGYMTLLAHTVVVGGATAADEKKTKVIEAAYNCLQAAVRLLKPGNFNHMVTHAMQNVCNHYEVNAVEGVLSHEIKRHLIDGNNVIINKETSDQRVAEVEFQVNQIYVLDCIVSSGEGKPKDAGQRRTVFKRSLDSNFDLKTRNARTFFTQLNKRFPSLAFSLRAFDDEILARAGSNECEKNGLIDPYPVLTEANGEVVAHFKWTVLISKKRIVLLAHRLLEDGFDAKVEITDPALKELLAIDLDSISKKKKKLKKKKAAAE